jgi:nuclear factor related to kappa-B-binding protein
MFNILIAVRDAVARLPNAQGTRADIVTLLKDSQYLLDNAQEGVLSSVVSGALDRLHSEHDPSVKYDPKRKIWVYLHKGRSPGEFGVYYYKANTKCFPMSDRS